MYWKCNNNSSSELDALLVKEDVTLLEVMDAEDIINQCKGQTKGLVDFLLKPENMEELVNLTTQIPSEDLEERTRFKYPNIACELLTSDVPSINERLASDKVLLDRLYSFLENEPQLNPLLASYFSRIMGALIAKKTEQNWLSYQFTCLQVLDFLKAKDTFLSLLLKHLGTSAIMDLMLKLMTQVESTEMRQNILNWLDSNRIMQSLVSLLNSKVDSERHYNVAQLLCDFIKIARDSPRNSTERVDPDPLLNTLETSETVSLLLDNIFEGEKSESAIVGGIQVLLALLDVTPCSISRLTSVLSYSSSINEEACDMEHKEKVMNSTADAIQVHLKQFHDLLLHPPKKASINTTVGLLEVPLGNTRLQIVKLLSAAILTKNINLLQEIVALDTFSVLLNLFFEYPWNNFLHTQVENCLLSALKTYTSDKTEENENALSSHLLVNCNLIDRILKAWKDNDVNQKDSKAIRQGYMGHLISIMNKIVELCSNTPLGIYINENLPEVSKNLEEFKNSTLKEANTIQDSLLGGAYPNSSNEETDEYGDIPFPQDQIYSNYQIQHLNNCIDSDNYTGYDDAFNDDPLQTIVDRTPINFSTNDGNSVQQHEMFAQICENNTNSLGGVDDDIFGDKEMIYRPNVEDEAGSSNDSDDDSPSSVPMDVDPWLSTKSGDSAANLVGNADPWGGDSSHANPELNIGDWADFSVVSFNTFLEGSVLSENKKVAVEKDLKVENIEIDASAGGVEKPNEVKEAPAGESKEEAVKEEQKEVKEIVAEDTKDNIENVAQTLNKEVVVEEVVAAEKEKIRPIKESEAGDVCDVKETGKIPKAVEPSILPSVTDGDSCTLESQQQCVVVVELPEKKEV